MKTDELIKLLSTNVEPVDRGQMVRDVAAAVVIGTAVAAGVALVALGIRADINDAQALTFLLLKLVFAVAIVVSGSSYLLRLARPGGEARTKIAWVAWPFVGLTLLAAISLAIAPLWHWQNMAMGDRWLECLISIPLIAIVPFAVVVWAVRRMAPTDLTRTGAFVGLVAGGISATGYALHCTSDSLPFIALWYGGTIALCTLAGAALGPRLLRW
ncbi:MAG TPA: DUF1109 domain-containing protein [Rhizobiales bacterium]|nr:DUF1109 domain-containing protein [Hyphomicrobiales bacterium]HAN62465.1 DUF1109 domain-containing protein [Hyphomicrobiales bacterium]HBH40346.1 DUF1109 domain-containing protein [Hyphomicrobiales bacterium]